MGSADAGATGVALRESVLSRLAETLTSPCFHLQRTDIGLPELEAARFGSKAEPPEYVFEARYEENLNQREADGSVVNSRLTIDLYYDGAPRERVASWSVTSGINSYTACVNRMFTNSDAVLKGVRPIEALLEDFERRPISGRIDLGAKRELRPGEEIKVKLLDFRDRKGRSSKYFNRVIVEVEHGRLDGGVPVVSDPEGDKRCAFRLDDLPLTLTYTAPSEGGLSADRITVYSSCQILDDGKVAMELTEPDKKIAEKEVPIVRPDLTAEFSSQLEALTLPGNFADGKFFLSADIRATYRLHGYSEEEGTGLATETYELISRDIKSFSGAGNVYDQQVEGDCVVTTTGSASVSSAKITSTAGTLWIEYDVRSGVVQEVTLQDFSVEFAINGDVIITEKCTKPPREDRASSPFRHLVIPPDDPSVLVVLDWPGFKKASGDMRSGTISGGGTEDVGPWRITLKYSFQRASDKQGPDDRARFLETR